MGRTGLVNDLVTEPGPSPGTPEAPGGSAGHVTLEQAEQDDHDRPDDPDRDGESVQVALRDAGAAQAGGHAAAEHVGQAAASTLVQEDEQGQEEAGQHQQHLQRDADNGHDRPRSRQVVLAGDRRTGGALPSLGDPRQSGRYRNPNPPAATLLMVLNRLPYDIAGVPFHWLAVTGWRAPGIAR